MQKIVFWLSLFLIFTIPFENTLPVASSATISKIIGLATAGLWISLLGLKARIRRPHPFHIMVFLFVLWNAASVYWSIDIDATVSRLITYLQLIGLIYIIWDMYLTIEKLKSGLQAYVLGAYVSVGSTIFNYIRGVSIETGGTIGRYTAAGFDANDLSLILALAVPPAWYLATCKSEGKLSQILKIVNYAYVPLSLFSVLLTASRGSSISFSIAFLYILLSFSRMRIMMRILIFIILFSTLSVLPSFIPSSSFERISSSSSELRTGNFGGRGKIWIAGFNIFLEHPFIGIGSASFRYANRYDKSPHNTYLAIGAELGLIGLTLFLIILFIVFHSAIYQSKWESKLWLILLLVWAVGAFTLTWAHRKPTLLFMSFIVASGNLPKRYHNPDKHRVQPYIFTPRNL